MLDHDNPGRGRRCRRRYIPLSRVTFAALNMEGDIRASRAIGDMSMVVGDAFTGGGVNGREGLSVVRR